MGARRGLFFDIALPWGLALYDIYSNDLKPDGIAFNRAIAGAVAGTIVAIMFFALSFTVVGTLIAAVIGFIDGFLQLLCSAGVSGTCWGIASSITSALVTFAYDGDSTINMNPRDSSGKPNLVQINDIDSGLTNPSLGMRVGNGIYYKVGVTTNLQHRFRHLDFYSSDRFFSENDLRESTFRYLLTTNPKTPYPKVNRRQMIDEWHDVIRLSGFRGRAEQSTQSEAIPLTRPGLNQHGSLTLKMAYAVMGYSCWFGGCDETTERGTHPIDLSHIARFDVFPETFTQFYAMDWSNASPTAAPFPTQRDRDGDGLTNNDPDDSTFDDDGDGVSDARELLVGTKTGVADTDGDGLSDYLELQIASDPLNPDSDSDGISDQNEVNGRSLPITPARPPASTATR